MSSAALLDDPQLIARVQQALEQTWFASYDPAFLRTDEGQADVADQVYRRYNDCVRYVVPWIARHVDLQHAPIVEIGCGTGSSTAGLAQVAPHVHGYDIDPRSIAAAKGRLATLGLSNVTLQHEAPERLLARVTEEHRDGVHVCLLYAVLEHQTVAERIELLRGIWSLLRDGGLLVVVETPNRLTFFDSHTAHLPFFHMLPDDVALAYYDRSPRAQFRDAIRDALGRSRAEAHELLTRWGRGVSYHEFELALGDLSGLVVATGYEPEMMAMFPPQPEEALLQAYFAQAGIDVSLAFARYSLSLILKKGGERVPQLPLDGAVPPAIPEPMIPGSVHGALARAHEDLARRAASLEERLRRIESWTPVRAVRRLEGYPVLWQTLSRAYWTFRGPRHGGAGGVSIAPVVNANPLSPAPIAPATAPSVPVVKEPRVYPRSYTDGLPTFLAPAIALPTDDELATANRIRSEFIFPGDGAPYMIDVVRAMRLLAGRRRYIEVGTYDKGCLAYMATLLAPDALLVDVDIEAREKETAKLVPRLQPGQRLATVVGDSTSPTTLEQVRAALGTEQADCMFIDGNHTAAFAWADYANFLTMLAPGGIMMFHDVYWQGTPTCFGVSQAMEWIDRVHPVHVVFADHPVHRFLPWLVKNEEVWGGVGIIRP